VEAASAPLTTSRISVVRLQGNLGNCPRSASTWISIDADLQITAVYNYLSITSASGSLTSVVTPPAIRRIPVEDIRIGAKIRLCGDKPVARIGFRFHDAAAERIAQERHRPGHDRFQRLTARREDSAIHSCRRQPWWISMSQPARRHTAER